MSAAEVVRYHMGNRAVVWVAVVVDKLTGHVVHGSSAYWMERDARAAAAELRREWGVDYNVDTVCALAP